MRFVIILLFVFAFNTFCSAQIVQINPNIDWKFIRSQDLTLQNNSLYQFEFPGEKGYDYIFTMVYEQQNFVSFFKVFDLQNKPIASRIDSSANNNIQLEFRVPQTGTYTVMLGYAGKSAELPTLFTKFSLIRRPIVD